MANFIRKNILLILYVILTGCGEDYNNVTPLPIHNACSVAIPDYPNECFTCRPSSGDTICRSHRTECLLQENQWGCYSL